MMKTLVLALVPVLCLSGDILLLSTTTCALSSAKTGCDMCNGGDFYLSASHLCFPPCPSGYKTLLPGYCVNSTIINQQQTFTLIQDPSLTTSSVNGESVCTTYNPECSCAPACPSGYTSNGCNCVYGSGGSNAETSHSHFWLYILSVIGVAAVIVGAGYLVKKFVASRDVKIPLQSAPSIEVSEKYVNIIESK